MTEEFVSEVKQIPHNDERIFTMLSDLSNLERIKDRIPQDKIKNFEFDSDTCSFAVDPVGKITFQIVEREPNKLIKFTTTNSPVPPFLVDTIETGGRGRHTVKNHGSCRSESVLETNGIETFARGCR